LAVVNDINVDCNLLNCSIFYQQKGSHGMSNTLRLLLSSQLKRSKLTQRNSGFTLIELLVAMLLAALVLAPLLTFMLNIMDTDRKEQAKATSEQELQAALDYIARDIEQAVYIYDADGLMKDNSATPENSGIKNQIPPYQVASNEVCNAPSKCQPVLVFWKREYINRAVPLSATSNNCSSNPTSCNDTFVYSLVGYYLIKDNDDTWSKAARIGRFQIQDGVQAPNPNGTLEYILPATASKGFQLFSLSIPGNNLKLKMNQWKKLSQSYTNRTEVLLDYIDQSTVGVPQVTCPAATPGNAWQAVPNYSDPNVSSIFKTYSFYACVNSTKTLAQVYLRGNALARVNQDVMTYSASNSNYFPRASIQVKGRGFLEAR
jgi:prepilin-type N-terminal cleavage/methylation domain-containing protein